MQYTVGRDFIKLKETSGTILNLSAENIIEMSTKPIAGSGTLIPPGEKQSYRYHTVYLRCINGLAKASCEPYDIDPTTQVDGDKFVEDGNYLHLTWDFPTGSNKTMLLRNPRPDLTISELQQFSEYTIEQDIFRNDFAEPTRGLKKIMMIRSLKRGKNDVVPEYEIPEAIYFDTRRILDTNRDVFNVDLRRRVKWRWLTRILPDSSFLDPKMYAAADALDDQITLFHWAIRNVLHIPRLDELNGVILDLLAYQFHVDAYDALNFTDEEKRELIRTSIAWHRIKGTPAAIEMILSIAFKTSRITEWFEYGGEPYYFRLYIKGTAYSPGSFQSFWRMFLDAKNVRSHLEMVFQDLSLDEPIKVYVGIAKVINGTKRIKSRNFIGNGAAGKVYLGVIKKHFGTVTKKSLIARPSISSGNIYAGVLKAYTGTKTVGMYQPT